MSLQRRDGQLSLDVSDDIADGGVWLDELTKVLVQELQTINTQEMCGTLSGGLTEKSVTFKNHPSLSLKMPIFKSKWTWRFLSVYTPVHRQYQINVSSGLFCTWIFCTWMVQQEQLEVRMSKYRLALAASNVPLWAGCHTTTPCQSVGAACLQEQSSWGRQCPGLSWPRDIWCASPDHLVESTEK